MLTSYKGSKIWYSLCRPADLDLAVPQGAAQTVKHIMANYPLTWAVAGNGNYFAGTKRVPEGLMAERGTVYPSTLVAGRPTLYIANGAPAFSMELSEERARAASMAMGAGPMLVTNNAPTDLLAAMTQGRFSGLMQTSLRARRGIGLTKDGLMLDATAASITLFNWQQFFVDMGCTEAMNIDGGSSATRITPAGAAYDPGAPVVSALIVREEVQVTDDPLAMYPTVAHKARHLQLSANFNEWEFRCSLDPNFRCADCDRVLVVKGLVDLLQLLRSTIGVPLTVSSGWRCPEHNKAAGGEIDSQHLYGMAADIRVPQGYSVDRLADMARRMGFTGIGRYYSKEFVHMDLGPARTWVG